MSDMWFSRWWKRSTRPVRRATRRRARLEVEALEERTLMNARFVVPAGAADNVTTFGTLHDALTTPGLSAGDVIRIEPNSSPGQLVNADIPSVKNLTIQGDPVFDVQSIPYFFVANNVHIAPAQQGFTLKIVQVDIQDATLEFDADGTITGCHIKYENATNLDAVNLIGTSAAVISDSYFESSDSQNQGDSLLYIQPANGSHNRITDNQFIVTATAGSNIDLIVYYGGAGITDVVAHNSFVSNSNGNLLDISGSQGLTVQGNTFFADSTSNLNAIAAGQVQNLQILDNAISIPTGNGDKGISLDPMQTSAPIAVVIANNHISTGNQGTGIEFYAGSPGSSINAKVENNDLQGSGTGVFIYKGSGGSVAGIDLGGGALGSLGANDFRGDTTAIDIAVPMSFGPIQAIGNIFGTDPTKVIYDQHNDATLAAVVSSNPLTGNAAYVETLYLDFLHRTGDVNNPSDAGAWVKLLGQGMPAATVANLIVRSPEALGVDVDGLYHRFLGRDADPAGRAGFVSYLQAGGTLEGVSQIMLASPEYLSRFPSSSSFVQSLYQNLLHRTASNAEVSAWVALLPQLGRAGVAQDFLLSQEFRDRDVGDDYTQLLHRTPSTAEVNSWVGTGLDILTIDALVAGSPEYQMNG
jgi:hypothetical protein